MAEPVFDKKEQLEKIVSVLMPNEVVYAVLDLKGEGTGFIGITNKRVIFYDKVFLRKMKAVVSTPFHSIKCLATEDESGLLTGRGFFSSSKLIMHTTHGDHEFEFRGADKAHMAHNLILQHMVD
jgi:hypothetical protein